MMAEAVGTPFDYPLSSRMDENDSILVFDKVFVPYENVFAYGDIDKVNTFFRDRAFAAVHVQGCTRLAVKLDFLAGLLLKAVEATGVKIFAACRPRWAKSGVAQPVLGPDDAMAHTDAVDTGLRAPESRLRSGVSGDGQPGLSEDQGDHREPAGQRADICRRARSISRIGDSPYLDQFVRGSNGYSAVDRVKLMKLMWDAIGTEFGAGTSCTSATFGNHESIRFETLMVAERAAPRSATKASQKNVWPNTISTAGRPPISFATTMSTSS